MRTESKHAVLGSKPQNVQVRLKIEEFLEETRIGAEFYSLPGSLPREHRLSPGIECQFKPPGYVRVQRCVCARMSHVWESCKLLPSQKISAVDHLLQSPVQVFTH